MRNCKIVVSALCCAMLVACASGGGTGGPRRGGNTVSAEELDDPSLAGLNAFDALRRIRPNWLRERGSSSIRASDDNFPKAIVNDVPHPIDFLTSVNVAEIASMTFISASDATTKYGTGFPNGAVMVSTVPRPD